MDGLRNVAGNERTARMVLSMLVEPNDPMTGRVLARPLSDFVTITGARASTSYGDHVARELAATVAAGERVVVAGGAYGIEGAGHQAALAAGGDTIAVLANGVDRPYPAGHRDLLDRVADVGVLVSEFPPSAVPTRCRCLNTKAAPNPGRFSYCPNVSS